MSHPFDEPLTPQERALAERLARLGPHDSPSATLDAKILAAAHAAVAPRRKRHWLTPLTGVPATLVTGTGMAAALALAIGVVWQLRPSAPAARAPRDEASEFGVVTAQIIERPEPAATPPPPPTIDAVTPVRTPPMPAMAKQEAAPAREKNSEAKEAPVPVADQMADHLVFDEAVSPVTHADHAATPQAYSEPPAPVFLPPPTVVTGDADQLRQRTPAQASATQHKAGMDETAKQADAADRAPPPSPPAPVVVVDNATTTQSHSKRITTADVAASSPVLDRTEAIDSPTRLADIPVQRDRELVPEAWLQRIRSRRDDGDLNGARQSLDLFRKAHPRVRLPDDLRTFADPTR